MRCWPNYHHQLQLLSLFNDNNGYERDECLSAKCRILVLLLLLLRLVLLLLLLLLPPTFLRLSRMRSMMMIMMVIMMMRERLLQFSTRNNNHHDKPPDVHMVTIATVGMHHTLRYGIMTISLNLN